MFLYVKKFDKCLDTIIPNANILVKKGKHKEKEDYDEYIEIKEVQNWTVIDGIL